MNNNYYFTICFNGNNLGTISGYEAAWDAYRMAKELAFRLDGYAALVDSQTGEIIDDTQEDED